MSEIETAGDWELVRAKFLFKKLQLAPPENAGTVTAFRDGQVTLRENRRTEGYTFATKEIGYQGVRPGDLVIHAMDAFAGAIGVSDSFGKCSPVYSVCEPKRELDVRYYAYLLRDFALSGRIASLTQGIRERSTDFRYNVFGELRLPYFDVDDQRAIASFLDRETARIDTLIEKKRRLLDLLEEKRTALITRAVTRGLDPDVPMKESGVEWIGEIPEHWGVVKLGYVAKRFFDYRGLTPRKLGTDWGGDVPAISATNVRDGYLDMRRGVNFGTHDLYRKWMRDGGLVANDILITTEAPMGNVALVPNDQPYILSQRVVAVRPRPDLIESNYLSYQFRCSLFQQRLQTDATGSTAEGISRSKLSAVTVLVPPIAEQASIAQELRRECGNIRRLTDRVDAAVRLLQEYRTALISAAVTGVVIPQNTDSVA